MPLTRLSSLIVVLMMIAGCESSDERLARMAEETTRQQAQQNERLAEQHHEIAQASRQLVEADAKARAEFGQLTRGLQTERFEIGHQRDAMEEERRQLARARQRDPIIATAVLQVGLVIACLLPLLVCIYVLRAVTSGDTAGDSQALSELLVLDLTSNRPLLLPPVADAAHQLNNEPLLTGGPSRVAHRHD